jgi:hypothetical protein
MAKSSEAAIWERIIHLDGGMTPPAARAILKLEFNSRDRKRMHELAQKAQQCNLTPDEKAFLDEYERVGTLLSVLKSRARKVLKRIATTREPS